MREIKFRGWDGTAWRYGDLIHDSCNGHELIFIDDNVERTRHSVKQDTVGQFTGLRDSDGREIYEDDIVRVDYYGEESIHVIKYCDDMDYPAFDLWPHFDCESNGLSFCECERESTITVIGNAHDNPELLERMI